MMNFISFLNLEKLFSEGHYTIKGKFWGKQNKTKLSSLRVENLHNNCVRLLQVLFEI